MKTSVCWVHRKLGHIHSQKLFFWWGSGSVCWCCIWQR